MCVLKAIFAVHASNIFETLPRDIATSIATAWLLKVVFSPLGTIVGGVVRWILQDAVDMDVGRRGNICCINATQAGNVAGGVPTALINMRKVKGVVCVNRASGALCKPRVPRVEGPSRRAVNLALDCGPLKGAA